MKRYYTAFRLTLIIVLINLLSFVPAVLKAQSIDGLPCNGGDPTQNTDCPIDLWVWVLVGIVVLAALVNLKRKKQPTLA